MFFSSFFSDENTSNACPYLFSNYYHVKEAQHRHIHTHSHTHTNTHTHTHAHILTHTLSHTHLQHK